MPQRKQIDLDTIPDATFEDILFVGRAMREDDFSEIICTSLYVDREELASHVALVIDDSFPQKKCFFYEGKPACILTWKEMWPGVFMVSMFATYQFDKIKLLVTNFVKYAMIRSIEDAGGHRIEAKSWARYETAHRWMEVCGFRNEGLHVGYGRGGEDFYTFAWSAQPPRAEDRPAHG